MFSAARVVMLLGAVGSLALGGCATFKMAEPAPSRSQAISMKFSNEGLSGWSDLPPGTHRVPDSEVIISGHQKGGAAPVLLFGLVGLAVQSAVNSSAGADASAQAENALKIDVSAQAQAVASRQLASGQYDSKLSLSGASGAPELSIKSGLVLSFVNDNEARPFVILKVGLRDPASDSQVWSTRYIASSGKPRPLTGPGSWTENNGRALQETVSSDLEHAMAFMLSDVSSPRQRDVGSLVTVEGIFPHLAKKLQVVGYSLGEDDHSFYVVPKLADAIVFSGINVLDKATTVQRPAAKDDAVFKVIGDIPSSTPQATASAEPE